MREVTGTGRAVLARERMSSHDRFLQHKTTNRSAYDALHAEARKLGDDDVIFMNERDEVQRGRYQQRICERWRKLVDSTDLLRMAAGDHASVDIGE